MTYAIDKCLRMETQLTFRFWNMLLGRSKYRGIYQLIYLGCQSAFERVLNQAKSGEITLNLKHLSLIK